MTTLETRSRGWPRDSSRPNARLGLEAAGLDAWIGANTLGQMVLQAVRRVDERELRAIASPDAGVAYRPLTLLVLVTYCYTIEIYAAAEIEDLMRRDAAFRAACGGEFPDWRAIRRFRRLNREAIRRSLVETFRGLAKGCMPGGGGEPRDGDRGGPNGFQPTRACRNCVCRAQLAASGASAPEARGDFTEQALADEAQRRIETATWLDQMTLDE
jgi:hypothetical protein